MGGSGRLPLCFAAMNAAGAGGEQPQDRVRDQNQLVRAFVAVSLPEHIQAVLRAWRRPPCDGVRYTTPAQWHVTLHFLGEVPDTAAVLRQLRAVPTLLGPGRPVVAAMGPAVAWFPGRRVLQVPVGGLQELADAVARSVAATRSPGSPPFTGHVTLARARGRGWGPSWLAGAPMQGSFPVEEIGLWSSTLRPEGSRYQVVGRIDLAS